MPLRPSKWTWSFSASVFRSKQKEGYSQHTTLLLFFLDLEEDLGTTYFEDT